MPEVRVSQLSKVFGEVPVLNDITFTIEDGEFFTLLGPSGCGKSTTLNCIAGLEDPTSGSITVGTTPFVDTARKLNVPPEERNLGMVFQSYALWPHMTIEQNLAMPLNIRRVPRAEKSQRIHEVLDKVGLAHLRDRYPHQLSGGQQQRVALARALVYSPGVLLLDEPLSNLDAKLRVGMRAELARLHTRLGVTTVYVTHDQVEAMTLGDRVAVLRDGKVQQCDAPERLFDAPANLFVAAFMGSPPMNLVPAAVASGRVRFAGVEVPLNGGPALPDGEVIAGVRPTDLDPVEPGTDPGLPRLRGTLEVVERLGAESHVIFPVDAPRLTGEAAAAADEATAESDATVLATDQRVRFTARVERRHGLEEGAAVEFAIRADALHLFDPRTGVALR
jgi:ABC-type sugar transport system ATPase subunit